MQELLNLFFLFARIGGLTFGGGYAMLPILQREIVDKRRWCSEQELLDYYAVGQCTPGIIAVNTATFIGYRRRGIIGAAAATLGVVFPSFIIISIIAASLGHFAALPTVRHALAGIRVCVCVLIFTTIQKLWSKAIIDKQTLFLFIIILTLTLAAVCSPVILVLLAAVFGLLRCKAGAAK